MPKTAFHDSIFLPMDRQCAIARNESSDRQSILEDGVFRGQPAFRGDTEHRFLRLAKKAKELERNFLGRGYPWVVPNILINPSQLLAFDGESVTTAAGELH